MPTSVIDLLSSMLAVPPRQPRCSQHAILGGAQRKSFQNSGDSVRNSGPLFCAIRNLQDGSALRPDDVNRTDENAKHTKATKSGSLRVLRVLVFPSGKKSNSI